MKKLLAFLLILLLNHTLLAQAPEKMSYQAVIRNSSNALIINQPVGMRISILQGSASGSPVYIEIYNPNPVTNINGLVSVEIGSGIAVTGSFTSIDWSNGPFFIQTETDPLGGTNYTITGTSQLLSVPYALFAKSSGSSIPGPQGPSGPAGAQGPQGIPGADGQSVLSGSADPTGSNGNLGDFYINTTNNTLFGPKTAAGWGSPISLIGPTGPVGPQGPIGATGAQGIQGNQGVPGATGPQGATGAAGPQGATGATGPQGATGATGPQGVPGTDGKTVLHGTTNPTLALGNLGDFYINTSDNTLFGPKTASGWGTAISLIGPPGATGPQGAQGIPGATGATGPQGIPGTDGKTLLHGTTNPTLALGNLGDFYINTSDNTLFGPKTASGWGSPISLIGPTGPVGPQGLVGATGTGGGGTSYAVRLDYNTSSVVTSSQILVASPWSSSGLTVTLSGSNLDVKFQFANETTPPRSIIGYFYNANGDKYFITSFGLGSNAYARSTVLSSTIASNQASNTFFTGFGSFQIQLDVSPTNYGGSKQVVPPVFIHSYIVFSF